MSDLRMSRTAFKRPDRAEPAYNGPTNFCWLIPGVLGGSPRPGIFHDISRDLNALRRVGTRLLVTLTSEWEPDTVAIKAHDMETLYAPIPDLEPPSIEQALEICETVFRYITRGEAVVFHCHAGKGRTGTMLAAMLIWAGATADGAIAHTRSKNPKWIESESQMEFLPTFAQILKTRPK